jgi:hypothetical protein
MHALVRILIAGIARAGDLVIAEIFLPDALTIHANRIYGAE